MASKTVTLSAVAVSTSVNEDQQRQRYTPDPYVFFKSHRATVGHREDRQMNTFTPNFAGPYRLAFGGPRDAEQIEVEVWDFDMSSADDLMERGLVDLGAEPPEGSKSFALSQGGQVTLTWRIQGRPEPPPPPPPAGGEPSSEQRGPARLQIKRVQASQLPQLDGRSGVVDPYVLLAGKSREVHERWEHQQNQASPEWVEIREVAYDPEGYSVEVWDYDFGFGNGDDIFGRGDVRFEPTNGSDAVVSIGFPSGGLLQVTYSLEVDEVGGGSGGGGGGEAPPAGPPPAPEPAVAVRKEIRKMPAEEQQRFVAALRKVMENTNGPQTSEYFRIAGYHGWPSDFCTHGQETFPGWHRGYLCDLEQALIRADRGLGNDGLLGLPYWDWTELEVNGEVFPKVIRDSFPELPEGLVDTSQAGSLGSRGYSMIRDDAQLRRELTNSQVAFQAEQCLAHAEHWMHASTRFNRQGYSVESPHNSVHMACGFPMTSLRYAAFHPIFFLHHCNVDRIYEKHVQLETPEECKQEFAGRQRELALRGEADRYREQLAPFAHPLRSAEPLMPSDTLHTERLGYVYDELPPTPAMNLREEPVFAAFRRVEVLQLNYKSYMLHVFILPKGHAAAWTAPESGPSTWPEDAHYGGCGAIFGGKGNDCCNCKVREPYNVLVEVQEALRRLGLGRSEAELRVMCEDEEGVVTPLEDTPVPPPVLIGPLFEDKQASLASQGSDMQQVAASGEVLQLQTALRHFGYYPTTSQLDGKFGPITEKAVAAFQKFTGLLQDGVAGPKTKTQLLETRNDLFPDVPADGVAAKAFTPPFVAASTVRYAVGPLPGYLEEQTALAEIHEAFQRWGEAMGLSFERTSSSLKARIQVRFSDLSSLGEARDGVARAGGQLAEATPQGVTLDAAERWQLRGQTVKEPLVSPFFLYCVLLHELGHCFGLAHSADSSDVMWPYYRPNVEAYVLSENDKRRVRSRVAPSAGAAAATAAAAAGGAEAALPPAAATAAAAAGGAGDAPPPAAAIGIVAADAPPPKSKSCQVL